MPSSSSSTRIARSSATHSATRWCRRPPTTSLLPSERRGLHASVRAGDRGPTGRRWRGQASRLVETRPSLDGGPRSGSGRFATAIEAGDASRAVYAYGEAARQYERAIELWDIVPAVDRPTDRDLGDLFDAASAAATLVGDASRAVNLARQGGRARRCDGRPGRRSANAGRGREKRLGIASWLAGDTATSIRLLEEAVDLLDGMPPSTDQARVLAGLAANLMLAGRSAESIPFAERAIECARAIGDQRDRIARR